VRGTIAPSADVESREHEMSDDGEFWFCLKHHTVEGQDGCRNQDRLGPYATADEASHALDKVAERNQDWDNDPKWNDDKDLED
jgi:hypothetical protein